MEAVIPLGSSHWSFPFGPSTTASPDGSRVILTAGGIVIGVLPIRDMAGNRLPDVSEKFAADLLFAGFVT